MCSSDLSSQYRARKEICGIVTPYGRLVQDVALEDAKGEELKVGMQMPLPFLHYNCEHSESYARMIMGAHKAKPSSSSEPWHVILYQDIREQPITREHQQSGIGQLASLECSP